MSKVWVGLSKWIGGYEGDHTDVVVGATQDEVVNTLFDSFDFDLVDWEKTVWDRVKFVKEGCEFWGEEGSVIVKELNPGELTKFSPCD